MRNCSFTDEEVRLMRAESNDGQHIDVIVTQINALPSNTSRGITRPRKSVREKLLKIGVVFQSPSLCPLVERSARVADDAFQKVMNAAIACGAEHVRFGIKKDDTPFTGRFIHAEPRFSGCTSSGAACADLGAPAGIGTGAV